MATRANETGYDFTFYLGVHKPDWISRARVPLFISRTAIERIGKLRPAAARWAMDSGGFTELSLRGTWDRVTPEAYVAEVRRASDAMGRLDFAMAQDWMCEPAILAKTGKSVVEHQRLTVANYLRLRELAPELPIIPVIQGWERDDYLRCVDRYMAAGVDLRDLPRVGLGSVCRRQGTAMAEELVGELAEAGIKLHLLGFKLLGLKNVWGYAMSSDSMAWSLNARKKNHRGRFCSHKNCGNCLAFAMKFRERIIRECVGEHEICPECGATDIDGIAGLENNCVECGHAWPVMLNHYVDGIGYAAGEQRL